MAVTYRRPDALLVTASVGVLILYGAGIMASADKLVGGRLCFPLLGAVTGSVVGGPGRCHRSARPGRPRPILRRLCASVLVFEAIVLILAVPVAITIEHLGHAVAGGVGGALALAAVVLAGLVGRVRWALVAGTVLQVLIVVAGIEVPALCVLGVIFAAFWFTGIWMANRLEQASTGSFKRRRPG